MTLTRVRLSSAVLTIATAITLVGVGPAHAANHYFSSCTRLHHVYKHGVSKSKAAARQQVRKGYGMPAYGATARKVYWENYRRLDRDRDGTACEA